MLHSQHTAQILFCALDNRELLQICLIYLGFCCSCVPQGTFLEPLLFFWHINVISLDIEYEIRFFVSDCDRYREIKDIEDTLNLQEDIERLGSWAENWVRDFRQSNVT